MSAKKHPNGRKGQADLLYASSHDANMLYATRFTAPDPFLFVGRRGHKTIAVSNLEVDRARKQAEVHRVIRFADVEKRLRTKKQPLVPLSRLVVAILRDLEIRSVDVPGNFPLLLADHLRRRGIRVFPHPEPFFTARCVKEPWEVRHIADAVRQTEAALQGAIDLIASARIRNGRLHKNGRPLTAEDVKRTLAERLLADELVASETIVACGEQACDPHDRGSGTLRAHQAIILDVFPRSTRTGYWADMTRTVVRGTPSTALRNVYAAVRDAEEKAVRAVRAGVKANEIHGLVEKTFAAAGFKTGKAKGRMQGFFHGTGHGVGLDLHEMPRVSRWPNVLQAGEVITIEPGLYYPGIGGVRIEDLVVVTDRGCRNLNRLPKVFEV